MSRVGSCVRNHSQMAKRFWRILWDVFARLYRPRKGWEGEGMETDLLSLWQCIYSMAICCKRKIERESVFHCECEWPGADLSWATPRVSHPRKLTWPWVGCPGKAQASGTCYPVPHGIHTSHIGRREIHTYTHKTWYIKRAHACWYIFTKVLSFSLFFPLTHTHSSHTYTYITFPEILREVKKGSQEGGRKEKSGVYCIQAIHKL